MRVVYCRIPAFQIHLSRPWVGYYLRPEGKLEGDQKFAMARVLMWVSDKHVIGWACSKCGWTFPLPSLLSDPEAKKAYDRLASAKFQRHDCAIKHQPVASLAPDTFIARAKGLVMRGFKPKDAAEIVSREIMFENHDDPDIARKVQIEEIDFLRRVKDGLT
jgi:hypothetical protein